MNGRAMRVMLRLATDAAAALPKGTWSATSRPRSRARGTSASAKYSSRWRRTSASSVVAGKTSTNRNSCVLNDGCDIAHSSIRSLHHADCTMRPRSPVPNSAMRRTRPATSASSDERTASSVNGDARAAVDGRFSGPPLETYKLSAHGPAGQGGHMALVVLLLILALVFGGIGLFVAAAKWALIIAAVLFVLSLFGGWRSRSSY